jgi:hypothetical protein
MNHSLFPGFAAEYVLRTRRLNLADYQVAFFENERQVEESDHVEESLAAAP